MAEIYKLKFRYAKDGVEKIGGVENTEMGDYIIDASNRWFITHQEKYPYMRLTDLYTEVNHDRNNEKNDTNGIYALSQEGAVSLYKEVTKYNNDISSKISLINNLLKDISTSIKNFNEIIGEDNTSELNGIIDTYNEIKNFLSGINDASTLTDLYITKLDFNEHILLNDTSITEINNKINVLSNIYDISILDINTKLNTVNTSINILNTNINTLNTSINTLINDNSTNINDISSIKNNINIINTSINNLENIIPDVISQGETIVALQEQFLENTNNINSSICSLNQIVNDVSSNIVNIKNNLISSIDDVSENLNKLLNNLDGTLNNLDTSVSFINTAVNDVSSKLDKVLNKLDSSIIDISNRLNDIQKNIKHEYIPSENIPNDYKSTTIGYLTSTSKELLTGKTISEIFDEILFKDQAAAVTYNENNNSISNISKELNSSVFISDFTTTKATVSYKYVNGKEQTATWQAHDILEGTNYADIISTFETVTNYVQCDFYFLPDNVILTTAMGKSTTTLLEENTITKYASVTPYVKIYYVVGNTKGSTLNNDINSTFNILNITELNNDASLSKLILLSDLDNSTGTTKTDYTPSDLTTSKYEMCGSWKAESIKESSYVYIILPEILKINKVYIRNGATGASDESKNFGELSSEQYNSINLNNNRYLGKVSERNKYNIWYIAKSGFNEDLTVTANSEPIKIQIIKK